MIDKKRFVSRPSRKLSLQTPKLFSNFCPRSKIWMFAIPGAINPPSTWTNVPKKRFLIRIFPGLNNLDPRLLNNSKTLRHLTGLEKSVRTISAIKEALMIVLLANSSLQAQLQLLGLIQPIFLLRWIVTDRPKETTKTWVRSSIIILTRRGIFSTNAPKPTREKTSIGLGNFQISDWY